MILFQNISMILELQSFPTIMHKNVVDINEMNLEHVYLKSKNSEEEAELEEDKNLKEDKNSEEEAELEEDDEEEAELEEDDEEEAELEEDDEEEAKLEEDDELISKSNKKIQQKKLIILKILI